MRKLILKALAMAAACALIPVANAVVDSTDRPAPPPNGNGMIAHTHFGPATGVAPLGGANGPDALVMVESRWLEGQAGVAPIAAKAPRIDSGAVVPIPLPGKGVVLNYCVFPSIAIQESVTPPPPSSSAWNTPFTLTLVELAAVKTTPNFSPVEVLAGIPANTTRRLGAPWPPTGSRSDPQPWCGQTAPGAPLPRLYLVVNGRPEAKVIWADAPAPPCPVATSNCSAPMNVPLVRPPASGTR